MKKTKSTIRIEEAVENLAIIAEEEGEKALALFGKRVVMDGTVFPYKSIEELTEINALDWIEVVKDSYKTLLAYLKEISVDPDLDWKSDEMERGLSSIIEVAGESAFKIDKALEIYQKFEKVSKCEEFTKLRNFYLRHIASRFLMVPGSKEIWESDWMKNEAGLTLDLEKTSLSEFDGVKEDREYELFYLRTESGTPFFTADLFKNIKIASDFDEAKLEHRLDPILEIQPFLERDFSSAVLQILKSVSPELNYYFKSPVFKEKSEFVFLLNSAIFALFLASDPKLLTREKKKPSEYFQDFHYFLRHAFSKNEYNEKFQKEEPLEEIKVLHLLAKGLFLRYSGIREAFLGYIYRLTSFKGSFSSFWEKILKGDEKMRGIFKHFPSGPLMKDLDVIRNGVVGFDPISQGNLPNLLFKIEKTAVLRMASPTFQTELSKAAVIGEFLGFLRSIGDKKILIVNLQDRTSLREYARSIVLEDLSKEGEFEFSYFEATLSENTDFYFQRDIYEPISNSSDFIDTFKEQLHSENSGFKFSLPFKETNFKKEIDLLLKNIHAAFFDKKKELTKMERLDFIEIFYSILTFKLLKYSKADFLSFVCKDGVDLGAARSASIYAIYKLLQNGKLSSQDEEEIMYLLYSSALLVRERPINPEVLNRTVSALSLIASKSRGLRNILSI